MAPGKRKVRKTVQVHRTTLQKAADGAFATKATRRASRPQNAAMRAAADITSSKRSRKGWTLVQAEHMLAQGYTEEHVRKMTGWPVKASNTTKEKKR